MIAAIHTFGELVQRHPHLHALVTDGAFAPDATFIPLPALDSEPFVKLWQSAPTVLAQSPSVDTGPALMVWTTLPVI